MAVLFLGTVLVLLALRESDREQLAREKEWTENLQSVADFIVDRGNGLLSDLEFRIIQSFGTLRATDSLSQILGTLENIADGETMVPFIFFAGKNQEISVPHFNPPYHTKFNLDLQPLNLQASSLYRQSEVLEFERKDYSAAIRSYQTLFQGASSREVRGRMLSRIARCFRKAGQLRQSVKTYQEMGRDYGSQSSEGGVPLGLLALFSIGAIHQDTGDVDSGILADLELYAVLLDGKWPLSKNQFDFYISAVEARIGDGFTALQDSSGNKEHRERWEKLRVLKVERFHTMEIIEILDDKIAKTEQDTPLDSSDSPEGLSYFFDSIGEESLILGIFSLSKGQHIGFLIDRVLLAETILSSSKILPSLVEDVRIKIVGERNKPLAHSSVSQDGEEVFKSALEQNFNHPLTAWKITLAAHDSGVAGKNLLSRRNIYVLLAIIMTSVIFFGGFMGLRGFVKQVELARLKSEFVATVSHELRTPLTSLRYMIDLLKMGRVPKEEKRKDYYMTMSQESERLSRLIENILDFSKIEAGMKEYRFEWTDVLQLTEKVIKSAQETASQKNFSLKISLPSSQPKVWMDGEAVSQALYNLLDNAFKYSETASCISLSSLSEADQVIWEVQDSGRGIPDDEQELIFDKFYRVSDQTENEVKGSGIGLTIVKHIVDAHRGDVYVRSEVGGGATFSISIPVDAKKS